MTIPPSSWRASLPRARLSETSDLPPAQLAALLASAGERVAALEAYREVLEAAPDDIASLGALGTLLARLGRDDEEVAIRRRIAVITVAGMGLAPAHRGAAVAFELALIGIGATPASMPSAYTAALFDGFAEGFDAWLRDELSYRAPELLHAALARALAPGGPTLDFCDVGCGTGLLGPLLRPLARRLDGVDCSSGMLAKAQELGLYDDLVKDDLTALLASRPGAYDVVTAADVLVYVGDLAPALAATALALRPSGLAAFTVERGGEPGYDLMASGRYQHAAAYVREVAAAAGLIEVSVDEVTLRTEKTRPVKGLVWVLRKPGASA